MSSTIEETFNPAALSNTISSTASSTKPLTNGTVKTTKQTQNYPRIEFEPLYTDLKTCIGHHWTAYHDALTRFIRGELSSAEFGYVTDEFIYATPAAEHAHNSLICAIVFNISRDAPDLGPAPWVSATTDKNAGTSSSKPALASDAVEQRLKTEVMALLPRDRKRLKGIAGELPDNDGSLKRSIYEEQYNAAKIKPPEAASSNTGGLTKTNWELEIKKRYVQSLFAESLEFPDASTIYARMVPICYEESVAAGSSMQSAELVATAAEVYLKGVLGDLFNRVRVNGPRYENGAGGGVLTTRFKKQILREEEEVKKGKLSRNRDDDLLPVESMEIKSRPPMTISDLKLASKVGPNLWNGMPLIGVQIGDTATDYEYDEWKAEKDGVSVGGRSTINGLAVENGDNSNNMEVDDEDYGWEGTGTNERDTLGSLLGDCLAIRA